MLQASDGLLYGVTGSGGATGNGTAFRIDLAGAFATLHDFVRNAVVNEFGGAEPSEQDVLLTYGRTGS